MLSGNQDTRLAYKLDHGLDPAVAISIHRQVVEVHQSAAGDLWYWSGHYNPDSGAITWNTPPRGYAKGQNPTLQEVRTSSYQVSEIHQDPTGGRRTIRTATIDWQGTRLTWSAGTPTTDALYLRSHAKNLELETITVYSGDYGTIPDVLLYQTTTRIPPLIIYPQLASVEYDDADGGSSTAIGGQLHYGANFYALRASHDPAQTQFMNETRATGKVLREWSFDEGDQGLPVPNLPATDDPFAPWYTRYLALHGAVS